DWARRKGARLVLNQNGVAYPAWFGRGWQHANREISQLLARADYVFYQSEFCRLSADRFASPARGPFEILHNAVDTSRFTPGPKPLPYAARAAVWRRIAQPRAHPQSCASTFSEGSPVIATSCQPSLRVMHRSSACEVGRDLERGCATWT